MKLLPVFIIITISIIALFNLESLTQLFKHLSQFITENKVTGAFLFVLLLGSTSLFFFPTTFPTILAGSVFPFPIAVLLVILGEQLNIVLAFVIGRTGLRSYISAFIQKDPRAKAIDKAVVQDGFKLVVLLRLTPIFPFGVISYILSVTQLPLLTICAASALGNIPGCILYVSVGAIVGADQETPLKLRIAMAFVGLGVFVGSSVFITLFGQKALRGVEGLSDSAETQLEGGDEQLLIEDTTGEPSGDLEEAGLGSESPTGSVRSRILESGVDSLSSRASEWTSREKRILKVTGVCLAIYFLLGSIVIAKKTTTRTRTASAASSKENLPQIAAKDAGAAAGKLRKPLGESNVIKPKQGSSKDGAAVVKKSAVMKPKVEVIAEIVEVSKVEEAPITRRTTRSTDAHVDVAPVAVTKKSVKVAKASGIPKKKNAATIKREIALKENSSDQITDDSAKVASKRKSRTSQNAAATSSAMASPIVAPVGEVEADVLVEAELPVIKRAKLVEHDDLDAEDADDPMMVSEYVEDIFEYLLVLEKKTMPNPHYMDNQNELQWKMRGILVDWIIEVHSKFRLLPETLYLSINLIDRFLSERVVSLPKLQLVGITALFISSKYEEVISPSLSSFLYMAEESYSEDEIIRAERYLLTVLDFNLQNPTPMSFLRRSSKADDYDIQTRTVAKYLMEVTLLDHLCLGFPASMVAAAGHYLARHVLGRDGWNTNLIYYSGYEEAELEDITTVILNYLSRPLKHEAVFKKYASRKFMKCAAFVKNWVSENATNGMHPRRSAPMNIEARRIHRAHLDALPKLGSDQFSVTDENGDDVEGDSGEDSD